MKWVFIIVSLVVLCVALSSDFSRDLIGSLFVVVLWGIGGWLIGRTLARTSRSVAQKADNAPLSAGEEVESAD